MTTAVPEGAEPTPPSGAGPAPMLVRRRRLLALVVAIAVGFATLGWGLGTTIRSSAEAARDAAPPRPSVVTAEVERRMLGTSVVARGEGQLADPADVAVDADLGGDGGQASRPIVTGRLPTPGQELAEGAVAVEVSGRPVFLLRGELPMYRRLQPGSSGPDVRQLEAALTRLGFLSGQPDERYDEATERAVSAIYDASGYEAVGPGDEDRQQLRGAQTEAASAEQALVAADAALATTGRGPPRSEVLAAEGDLAVAVAALERSRADRGDAVASAAPDDRDRVQREHDGHVLEAENRVAVSEARLAEVRAPRDTTPEKSAVTQAARQLSVARAQLASLEADIGVEVPRGEVVFLADLPRRVDQVHVGIGAEPSGPVLTLSAAALEVVTSLAPTELTLVEVGDEVRLDDPALGIDNSGTVTAIADAPGGEGAAPGAHLVRVRPADDAPAELLGANVRITIPVESTDGEVLAVPVAAVWAAADGSSRVRVVRGDEDGHEDVVVRVGLSADGSLEIAPVDGGLQPGDEVILGLR